MDIRDWLPEFKVSAESDAELQHYFLKTRYVEDVSSGTKWLVLGRKGTGKTAIYEYFKKSSPVTLEGAHPLSLNFKDYPWPIHKLYKESMEGELTAYQKSWHYLLIVQSLAEIIRITESSGEKLSKDLANTKKYLSQIYGNPFPSIIEIIKSKIARLDGLSLPTLEAGEACLKTGEISFEEISADNALRIRLRTNAFTLLTYFEKVLLSYSGSVRLLICIDQLDENWLQGEIEEYSKILINLIQACQHINTQSDFRSRMRTVIFLRTDIYETLMFNDKNKIYQDSAVEIRWDTITLNSMFHERIKRYVPDNPSLDHSLKSNCIFEVRHVRHGATPFTHILRRTFYRPRDIIVYLNKVRGIHIPVKSGLYTSKDIYGAEKDYSLSMYQELIDEWGNQRQDIGKELNVLQSIGVQSFTAHDYIEHHKRILEHNERSRALESLRFLFINSVIGQKKSANWEYVCVNPYMQMDIEKKFHVNSGLKDRLMLTESRSARL